MTALPCASSWVAARRAVMLAKIDWLIWIVSVSGVKFTMVTWPKFGAKTKESWPAVAKRCDGLLAGLVGTPITPSAFRSWWKLVSSDSKVLLFPDKTPTLFETMLPLLSVFDTVY